MIVLFLTLTSPLSMADDADDEVATWTSQTLLQTLSVDYNTTKIDFAPIKTHYTYNAWNAIRAFLGDQMTVVKQNALTVVPVALADATVSEKGDYNGILYWRVEQQINLAALNISVNFSLIVIKTQPGSNPPYLIQSMTMEKISSTP